MFISTASAGKSPDRVLNSMRRTLSGRGLLEDWKLVRSELRIAFSIAVFCEPSRWGGAGGGDQAGLKTIVRLRSLIRLKSMMETPCEASCVATWFSPKVI